MEKHKIEFKNEETQIENPDGFEFKFSKESGLNIGEISTNIDLAVKILVENTTEGQMKFKKQNDTDEIKYSLHILQATQAKGMLDIIFDNENSVEVIITRIN